MFYLFFDYDNVCSSNRKLYDTEDDCGVEEGKEPGTVMKDVLKACKKVEPDCEIAL